MVKNICSFCSGPRFLFQHPHGDSQSNSNPLDPVSSFEPHGYWELNASVVRGHMQAEH